MNKKNQNKKISTKFLDCEFKRIQSIRKFLPEEGQFIYNSDLDKYKQIQKEIQYELFKQKYWFNFQDLPISNITIGQLKKNKFVKMTEVQRCVIPHALAFRDVLCSSKTGSGKSLSFLIPCIEKLFYNKFSKYDGCGALILTPTRELAIQIYDVLNQIGSKHIMKFQLLIGGKNYHNEKNTLNYKNIIVSTPGRLLQHLEETYNFSLDNIKLFVMDEADMLLQMGFLNSIKRIVNLLPSECQKMLFSATLNQDVQNLGKISLQNPQLIYLNQDSNVLPSNLNQHYVQVQFQNKLSYLYSFLKQHVKYKIIIFVPTCKYVQYVYKVIKKLKVSHQVLELHGNQSQKKRMALFYLFSEFQKGTLITTNLASRGLDFPKIDWVVQLDCPENLEYYIHRIGRTARLKENGNSLVLVDPNEMPLFEQIKEKIQIKEIKINMKKIFWIQNNLFSLNSEHSEIKELAEKALKTWISYFLQTHKIVIDFEKISTGFGLNKTPIINQIQQENIQESKKNKIQKLREKKKQFKIFQKSQKEEIQLEDINRQISKRQFNKVKPYGYFDGENIKKID